MIATKDLRISNDFGLMAEEGDYPYVFAAKNRSDEVRMRSSSGGMFHALANHIISSGGIVYGCAFNDELRAVHIRCETMADAERCMGSKYSQSRMGDTINHVKKDLRNGRTVLFTGTPCQVDAVRSSCMEFDGLFTVDIICHGVPSPALFQEHIVFIERTAGKKVVGYLHRPKNCGWAHVEQVRFEDGTEEQNTWLSNSWRNLFYSNKMLRPTCCECPYTDVVRTSDLTIADYWGIDSTRAAYFKDDAGVSLVLVNTDRGLSMLKRINVNVVQSTIQEAIVKNPMLERPSRFVGSRDEPWVDLCSAGYETMLERQGFFPSSSKQLEIRAKRKIKRFLGLGK